MSVNDKLKSLVKYTAKFKYYRQGELWYNIDTDDEEFLFPISISDAGTAVFYTEDRAVIFMRWIRKQLESIEAGKAEQGL